jgi:hypothetical protein
MLTIKEVLDPKNSTRRQFLVLAAGFPLFPWNWFRRKKSVEMGEGTFNIIRNGGARRFYFWVHGNERTAREVLLEHIKTNKGRAVMVENDQRYLTIEGGRLDPNRMFSREGASKNLRSLNRNWDQAKLDAVLNRLDRERPELLKTILPGSGRLLVAMHNNSQGYSVKDELAISDRTALNNEANPHEFMLCTSPADFEILRTSPFNVVLQNTGPKEDDGSLSRLCALRKIRYVNIEAALGKAAEQKKMLDWLEANLPETARVS